MSNASLSGKWGLLITDYDTREPQHVSDLVVLRTAAFLVALRADLPRLLWEVTEAYVLPYPSRRREFYLWHTEPREVCYHHVPPLEWYWLTPVLAGCLVFAPALEVGCIRVSTDAANPYGDKDVVAVHDLLTPGWLDDYILYQNLRSVL